jgi:pimeloyl-ACP methyl ester carboxylesterase
MADVEVAGGRIHYEAIDLAAPWIAEPQTVLMAHGLGSVSGAWAEWLPSLVDGYRVVRFDMRGHGRSVPFAAQTVEGLDTLLGDVLAVADAAGLDRFHFVGESIGGTLGLRLAARHGDRLLSLTASNAAHLGSSIRSVADFADFIAAHGMAGWSRRMMSGRFFDGALSEEARAWYERQQALPEGDLVLRVTEVLVGLDLRDELPAIRVPTLLLQGDSSPFISGEMMAEIQKLVPDARLQVFARGKHGLPVSHARESAAVLRRFLDELRAGQ